MLVKSKKVFCKNLQQEKSINEQISQLANKIIQGNQTWNAEELQLQINYSEMLERILRDKYSENN